MVIGSEPTLYNLFVDEDVSHDILRDAVSRGANTEYEWAYLHVLSLL